MDMQFTQGTKPKSMKKFVIREAETLKTTRAALYVPDSCGVAQ